MKMRIALGLTIFCGAMATAFPAIADPTFASANQAYQEGRFQDAVDGYESLARAGNVHANLFYDLGNAWYRLGNFGNAILNYERALALDPHHPEADANLRLARDEARALELRRTPIEGYAAMFTVKQYSIAAAIGFWLTVFVAVRLFTTPGRRVGRVALVVAGLLLCGTSVASIVTLENGGRGNTLAIVTGKEIVARLATADNAKSVLVLPAGSEIKILSERGDWVYALLPNDQRGWIPATSAERVRL
jgi:tetratricopeptide (TPR) repeat protein